jgi:RNA polymerase sigma-70 factor (ECF subfamily)
VDKKELFIAAIKHNERLIYKIASVYTNNIEDQNDLVQEITYQLWKSFETFKQKSNFSTWMYRVAMNVAIHYLKTAKKKIATIPIDDNILHIREAAPNDQEEQWKLFKQLIDRLSLLDKGIVILYLEEKSYEEIAEILGISKSNVGTKLSRIKEKMKHQISKQLS